MLLGNDKDFLCVSLNYSCSADVQATKENSLNLNSKNVSSFVWFEDPRRKSENDMQKEKAMIDIYTLQDIADCNEFVWFEDWDKESQEMAKSTENLAELLTDAQNQNSSWPLAYFFNFFV